MLKRCIPTAILLIIASFVAQALDEFPSGEGIIVSNQGVPVSGATIRVLGMTPGDLLVDEFYKTQSASKGEFSFQPVKAMKQRFLTIVTLSHPDFGFLALDESGLNTFSASPSQYRIELPEKGMLRGLVKDSSGQPVTNCKVTAGFFLPEYKEIPAAGCFFPTEKEFASMTGSDGVFSIEGLPMDRKVVLLATHTDFAPMTYGLQSDFDYGPPKATLKPGDTNITITLAVGGQIAGTVTARSDGRPVGDAQIFSYGLDDAESVIIPPVTVRSEKDGRYMISHLRPGYYTLHASAEDLQSATVQVKIPESGKSDEQSIILETKMTVAGKVVNHVSGKPFAPDDVTVLVTPENEYQSVTSPVAGDGSFSVRLIPGLLHVRLETMLGRLPNSEECKIVLPPDADRTDIVLDLVPYPCFKGRVLDEQGKPVAGATITGEDKDQNTTSENDGAFCVPLRNYYEGQTYVVYATHPKYPGFRGMTGIKSESTEGVQGDIVLKGAGVIHGRVVDAEGNPISKAKVSTVHAVTQNYYVQDTSTTATTNEKGEYKLSGLLADVTYQISASCPSDNTLRTEKNSRDMNVVPQQNQDIGMDDICLIKVRPHKEEQPVPVVPAEER